MLKNINIILKRYISNLVKYRKNKDNARNFSVWVFGEWFGTKCSDNVLAFANYVAQSTENLDLYWICNNECDTNPLSKKVKILKEILQKL